MLTIRTTALLAAITTTQAIDYFKASCTAVPAGTVSFTGVGEIGPTNACLAVGSIIVKCTGCGSSADCKLYDYSANAPCSVASSDQSMASSLTCDENTPGTAVVLEKFVDSEDDFDCSGTRKFLL